MSTPDSIKKSDERPITTGLGDRYENISQIGSGGMGVIYKAKDTILDKWVAIKFIGNLNETQEQVLRFQQEAKAASKLNHPNLITILDFGLDDNNIPYLVMDYIEGQTLSHFMRKQPKLDISDLIAVFIQVCEGLEHAHIKLVIHRDLKPSNILVTEDGIVKIIDFGIAKPDKSKDSHITKTGVAMGSPSYMSPEQVTGALVDERSDIYSLGCVIFQCLSGSPPFHGETPLETMNMHLTSTPNLNASLDEKRQPHPLEKVVYKALQKSPEDRYQSMSELMDALNQADDKESIDVHFDSDEQSQASSEKSSTFRFGLAAFLGTLIIVLLVSFLLLSQRQSKINETQVDGTPARNLGISMFQIDNNDFDTKSLKLALGEPGVKKHLSLKFQPVSNENLKVIGSAYWIKTLVFTGAEFEDTKSLIFLKDLTLERLVLGNSNFDDKGAEAISHIKSLTTLSVAATGVTDEGVKHLAKIKNLKLLKLSVCKITDESLNAIAENSQIKTLYVKGCVKLTDKGLQYLGKSRYLKFLDVPDCGNLTVDGIERFKKTLPGRSVRRN